MPASSRRPPVVVRVVTVEMSDSRTLVVRKPDAMATAVAGFAPRRLRPARESAVAACPGCRAQRHRAGHLRIVGDQVDVPGVAVEVGRVEEQRGLEAERGAEVVEPAARAKPRSRSIAEPAVSSPTSSMRPA